MSNIQQNIEDKTFKSLIKRLTREREWSRLSVMFAAYGIALEERDKEPADA